MFANMASVYCCLDTIFYGASIIITFVISSLVFYISPFSISSPYVIIAQFPDVLHYMYTDNIKLYSFI